MTKTTTQTARERAVHMLFETGGIRLDFSNGFPLPIHDSHPDAPLSPLHIDITRADFHVMGEALADAANRYGLFQEPTWTAAVPETGERILNALRDHLGDTGKLLQFTLTKQADDQLAIDPMCQGFVPCDGEGLLLVDDSLRTGERKQRAYTAIRSHGARVSNLLVFFDESDHLGNTLARSGITMVAVWRLEHLLDYAQACGLLNRRQRDDLAAYPEKLRRYLSQAR